MYGTSVGMKSLYVLNYSGFHTVSVHDVENRLAMDYERAKTVPNMLSWPCLCERHPATYDKGAMDIILKWKDKISHGVDSGPVRNEDMGLAVITIAAGHIRLTSPHMCPDPIIDDHR